MFIKVSKRLTYSINGNISFFKMKLKNKCHFTIIKFKDFK